LSAAHLDLVEDTVPVGTLALSILRPRDSAALLDEEAFEHEEFMPYWAELWPSGVALARAIADRSLGGMRIVELGCGLGLPSMVAALAGARVLATDWSQAALELLGENAARNGAALETMLAPWTAPSSLVRRAPFDLVLGSDLLYEARNVELLAVLLPQLAEPRTEVLIADPGRPLTQRFLEAAAASFRIATTPDRKRPNAAIYRLRPSRPGSRREPAELGGQ